MCDAAAQAISRLGSCISCRFSLLARLDRRPFPVRFDDRSDLTGAARCFDINNASHGRTMMIAPDAVRYGLIDMCDGPIGAGADRNWHALRHAQITHWPTAASAGRIHSRPWM